MIDLSTRFCINHPDVIHEVIDGEAVIVHFDSGNYYSLRDIGAEIWSWVEDGFSIETIVQQLADRYLQHRAAVQAAVLRLIVDLQTEDLIRPQTGPNTLEWPQAPDDHSLENLPFPLPTLEKFTDMQQLLLLDPIHEVTEDGWPNIPAQPEQP